MYVRILVRLTIQNSQLNSNTASSGGAVVDVDVASGSATLTLADSTVLSNTSEGWRALALTTTGGSLSARVNGVSFSGNLPGSIWISAAPGTFSLSSQMSDFADATDVILANLPLSFTVETVAFTCNATGCAGQ